MIKPLKETGEHSYHRRAFNHNYYSPFIYHIILKKTPACCAFGNVSGDASIAPGNPGAAFINESLLGTVISKALLHLPHVHYILKLLQFCVMPDHVHILFQVQYTSAEHLDFYVESLKKMVATRYSEKTGHPVTDTDIFEPGYCDKPLYDNRSLDGLYKYIRENPHRLAMRQQYPQFFTRTRQLTIDNKEYEAYGNLFLFRNPDKEAVKISRKFTPQEKEQLKSQWLQSVSQGTILVSPFISREERAIRSEAEALGARLILIVHEAFPERFKPAAHDFELCEQGRLLIISLGHPMKTPLTRDHCVTMNSLAKAIATAATAPCDKPAPPQPGR